jgi:hypothetical protein
MLLFAVVHLAIFAAILTIMVGLELRDRRRRVPPDVYQAASDSRAESAAMASARHSQRQLREDGQRAAQDIVLRFAADVASIASAIEHGERPTIPAEQLEQLGAAYALLLRMVGSAERSEVEKQEPPPHRNPIGAS